MCAFVCKNRRFSRFACRFYAGRFCIGLFEVQAESIISFPEAQYSLRGFLFAEQTRRMQTADRLSDADVTLKRNILRAESENIPHRSASACADSCLMMAVIMQAKGLPSLPSPCRAHKAAREVRASLQQTKAGVPDALSMSFVFLIQARQTPNCRALFCL